MTLCQFGTAAPKLHFGHGRRAQNARGRFSRHLPVRGSNPAADHGQIFDFRSSAATVACARQVHGLQPRDESALARSPLGERDLFDFRTLARFRPGEGRELFTSNEGNP